MRARLRFLILFAAVLTVILVAALAYMAGMARLEGEPRDFWTALEFAAETITTTGYGGDSHWRSPWMVLFVIALQLLGVMLIYMVVPLFLIPALEERFESRLPRRVHKLRDHVVIVRAGPSVETVIELLARAGVETVVIETDDDAARDLVEAKQRMVYAPRAVEALDNVCLQHARALIANDGDEENANLILAARQRGFEGEILALVEERFHRQPIRLAGATQVYTPRIILAATLAARASHRLGPRVSGLQSLGGLQVTEVRIDASSALAGNTLTEAKIGERTGATVIGLWLGGELTALPKADSRLAPRAILVALGTPGSLERLAELAGGSALFDRRGPWVIAGHGEVGAKVAHLLREVGEQVEVIDRHEGPGVDRVGDVLDRQVLDSVDLERARGVILALDSDSATLFATVLVRGRDSDLPIIARVNEGDNVERIHRAGADFALSISQVSGQMLARSLLGRDEVAIEPELVVTRVPASASLFGDHPHRAGIRRRTGCSVVAVERGDQAIVRFDPRFRLHRGDTLFICGNRQAIGRFRDAYGD